MEQLELCGLDFLQSNNIFTGSRGDFRYRVAPEEGQLVAAVYHTYCYEKADPKMMERFALDGEGYAQLCTWLAQQYQEQQQKEKK